MYAIIPSMLKKLSHLNESGSVNMVDVGSKSETSRQAIAEGEVKMQLETLRLIQEGNMKKGDVLTTAKIAGILGAKHTSDLIPLCHPLQIDKIDIEMVIDEDLPGIRIRATVSIIGKTGVEMEALTAVAITALTIYDMAKAVEKTMIIQNVHLVEKKGGKSGTFQNR